MFDVQVVDNDIYVAFQDLSQESRNLFSYISQKLDEHKEIPSSLHRRIEKLFIDNTTLSSNLLRQKSYISNLKIYIDIVDLKKEKKTYYLHLYILPKEIRVKKPDGLTDEEYFRLIERLSLKIFKLYNKEIEKKDVEFKALKEFKGESFLDLELSFYEQELKRLYDYLLNYRRSLSNKIVCSDKPVGIPIDEMNMLEPNPLKQYQFVKVAHQEDLIVFVYTLVDFLLRERVERFRHHEKYARLKEISFRIYNFLKKISTNRHLRAEHISMDTLKKFFIRYKNSPEIQKNRLIYDILENIFSNQLKDGVFVSKSIDLTRMFELLIEKNLRRKYGDILFVGDEAAGRIKGAPDYTEELNEKNFLLQREGKHYIKQFPDYLVRNEEIYHVIDAKYKLLDRLLQSRENFWQILIYAQLFNKEFITKGGKFDEVQKVIIYADVTDIELSDQSIDSLEINDMTSLDIFKVGDGYRENVFDSSIRLIGVQVFSAFT